MASSIFGASAVLLFAVSSGALAQPWSIIGSYLCAGVIALLVARVLGPSLGGACLAAADLPERPDLGPWLACVLVEPEARGRGLAAQLIEAICAHASSLGIPRLYLHTHDQSAYYAKRGWQVLERFHAWDNEQWLMVRDL